ncbi:MAG: hypothetical protein ACRD1R_19320 [Acidobacteriota bacterium]
MDTDQEQRNRKIQEFLGREFGFRFTAGECNFLIQLLAYVAQENPPFVPSAEGKKDRLNYQSIRSIVLLNDKLNSQMQKHAADASVIIDDFKPATERVQ